MAFRPVRIRVSAFVLCVARTSRAASAPNFENPRVHARCLVVRVSHRRAPPAAGPLRRAMLCSLSDQRAIHARAFPWISPACQRTERRGPAQARRACRIAFGPRQVAASGCTVRCVKTAGTTSRSVPPLLCPGPVRDGTATAASSTVVFDQTRVAVPRLSGGSGPTLRGFQSSDGAAARPSAEACGLWFLPVLALPLELGLDCALQ